VPCYILHTPTQQKNILIISLLVSYDPITDLTVIYILSIIMSYIYCKCCIDTVMYVGFHADLLLLNLYAPF
jgi:hypothetical protein